MVSLDEMKDNFDFDIPDENNVEDEALLKLMLKDLFKDLKHQDSRSFQILTLLLEGHSKQKIIEILGLRKSRGYQEIDNAKETLKEYLR